MYTPATSDAGQAPVGVCLATGTFYPAYSGPVVRFHRYAKGLEERGINLHVFTEALDAEKVAARGSLTADTTYGPSGSNGSHTNEEVIDGLPVHRVHLPTGWRRQPSFLGQLLDYCETRRDRTRVVQFLSLEKWAVFWLRRLRRLGVRTVYTKTMMAELSPNRWKRTAQKLDRALLYNFVDRVVVSSTVMRSYLEELSVSTPIEVIPNGVDLERFQPTKDQSIRSALRSELGLGHDWPIVLFVGPINPRKGVDVLVEAFARVHPQFQDAHLVLVGPRHDLNLESLSTFRDTLQRTIRQAGASERVHFVGAVGNVEDYLRASDLMVFPSRREGMPNVVPEAMACGLPLISTPFVGLPEEFGRPGTEYVLSSWDPVELASEIQGLLQDSSRRRTFAKNARGWVERNLDSKHSLDDYAALYGELAAGSGARCG